MNRDVTFVDIARALDHRDPQLAELIVRYLEQRDPPEDRPEGAEDSEARPISGDAWTLQKLRRAVSPNYMRGLSDEEAKARRLESWQALFESSAHPPPRLRLGDLLIDLYASGQEWGRRALIEVFRRTKLSWGLWKAFKAIYKQAELAHDAEMFGVLAWRLDVFPHKPVVYGEISPATLSYMRRRAWRYLRQLGTAVPELYPQFAVQVLRHYEAGFEAWNCWILPYIWNHGEMKGDRTPRFLHEPPQRLANRAFDEAWKISPDPLLRLIEDSDNDAVLRFATRSLEADFPDTLRDVDPGWLARLGRKPAGSVHEFVISLLERNPAFHQSKLANLGLHAMVLELLASPSEKAAKYAVDYANAHAGAIPPERLVELLSRGTAPARGFAQARLDKLDAKAIGLLALVRLLDGSAHSFAEAKLSAGITPQDLTSELYIELLSGNPSAYRRRSRWLDQFFAKHDAKPSAALLRDASESLRLGSFVRRKLLVRLGEYSGEAIGVDWIRSKLLEPGFSTVVGEWLVNGKLSGDQLDVEWLKGLAMNVRLRGVALKVLGNTKLVAPRRIGLPWLLALVRQGDPQLWEFARNHLLEHFEPGDFADGDREAGLARLWSLAGGTDSPESTRRVAQLYLRTHHPELGPEPDEPLHGEIEAKLSVSDYGHARVRALLFDGRSDVRRFAATIAGRELVRWDDRDLVYALAASSHREARRVGSELLLEIGSAVDGRPQAPLDWLIPARVFALAESTTKASREVASALIRRHYRRLGGAARLAWLMESPDPEVRMFAVRMLWEQHRPVTIPTSWRRAKGQEQRASEQEHELELPGADERFETGEALRQFLRTVLFGLPQGRMERREPIAGLPTRRLSASESKRRLIAVVRDLAIEDPSFAGLAAAVLDEFMNSRARGEWQGCVAALARIRAAHPEVPTALPPPRAVDAVSERQTA